MPMISDWSPDHTAAFLRAPVHFRHGLGQPDLVEDEALARLLDGYPADLFDINHFDFHDEARFTLRTGDRGRASGAEVLKAVKEGLVWVNLREADAQYPALGAQMQAAFRELSQSTAKFRPVRTSANLILSSPANKTPYHADAPGVVFFHLRGRKRVWIYPVEEKFVAQAAMEHVAMKYSTEEIPFDPTYDDHAQVYDVEPGMGLAWPFHAPHRVENLQSFNVSLSVEYQTWESRVFNGAFVASGVLRRWRCPTPSLESEFSTVNAGLWACSVLMKRLGLVKSRLESFQRSFELGAA